LTIVENITNLAQGVAESNGAELVEVQVNSFGRKKLVKIFIHKSTGVTVADCTAVSRGLEPLLDAEGTMEDAYTLEVSSPGIDKPLVTAKDFERSVGRKVSVSFQEEDESVVSIEGRLKGVEDSEIELELKKSIQKISIKDILKSKVEVEF